MAAQRRFSKPLLQLMHDAKMIGVRSGTEHRYTGVWAVVVGNRVFVRSWNDKPTGWYRAFRQHPQGSVRVGEREVRVRAKAIRSQTIRDAVTRALGEKYNTPASQIWVRGFAEAERAANTLELVPR